MKKHQLLSFILTFLACPVMAQTVQVSDKQATKETVNLFNNLDKLRAKGYLVGHQDDLAYGVNWKYKAGRSDIKDMTGDNPAVYGWELGNIEVDSDVNLDTVPFNKMKSYIREGYERGAVITISWHGDNPMTGKSAWDPAPGSVFSVLPGQKSHAVFVKQLDKVAAFLADLKDSQGNPIPILFRPFHELTGNWFWWGTNGNTPGEFKMMFRFAVDYLRNKKNLHNLLIGYNTGGEFKNKDEFLQRYPGDDVVDIVSFDTYAKGNPETDTGFISDLKLHLNIIEQVAKEHGKVSAIGEIGFNQIPYGTWFTKILSPALQGHNFAYLLFWRNAGYKANDNASEYYVPYKGHPAEADFVKYYTLPQTLFEKEAAALQLYK
ncbi:MAG: glycosyl hydrolase [Mucilaginibacter sp.]